MSEQEVETDKSSLSSEDRQERTEGLIMTDDQYNKIRTILQEYVSNSLQISLAR